MLGRLNGMSDIQAYKHVGDALDAEGAFNPPPKSTGETKTETKKPAKVVDAKRNAKRKAAGPTKQSVSPKKAPLDGINPLALSDEEFEKMAAQNLFI